LVDGHKENLGVKNSECGNEKTTKSKKKKSNNLAPRGGMGADLVTQSTKAGVGIDWQGEVYCHRKMSLASDCTFCNDRQVVIGHDQKTEGN